MKLQSANASDPIEIRGILNSLIYFTLKNTTGEYRMYIYQDAGSRTWNTDAQYPIHVSEDCELCDKANRKYEKGEYCETVSGKNVSNLLVDILNDKSVRLRLLLS